MHHSLVPWPGTRYECKLDALNVHSVESANKELLWFGYSGMQAVAGHREFRKELLVSWLSWSTQRAHSLKIVNDWSRVILSNVGCIACTTGCDLHEQARLWIQYAGRLRKFACAHARRVSIETTIGYCVYHRLYFKYEMIQLKIGFPRLQYTCFSECLQSINTVRSISRLINIGCFLESLHICVHAQFVHT